MPTFFVKAIIPFQILSTPTPTPRRKESVSEKKIRLSEIGRGINFTLVERKIPLVPKKSLVILLLGGDLPPAAVSKQREERKEEEEEGKKGIKKRRWHA